MAGGFAVMDEVDRLNAAPFFAPGTLNLVNVPAGADISGTSASGGTLVASHYDAFVLEEDGQLTELIFEEYRNLDLNLQKNGVAQSGALPELIA